MIWYFISGIEDTSSWITTSISIFFSHYKDNFICARQPRSFSLIESQKTNLSENFLPLELSISLTLPSYNFSTNWPAINNFENIQPALWTGSNIAKASKLLSKPHSSFNCESNAVAVSVSVLKSVDMKSKTKVPKYDDIHKN